MQVEVGWALVSALVSDRGRVFSWSSYGFKKLSWPVKPSALGEAFHHRRTRTWTTRAVHLRVKLYNSSKQLWLKGWVSLSRAVVELRRSSSVYEIKTQSNHSQCKRTGRFIQPQALHVDAHKSVIVKNQFCPVLPLP